MTEALLTRRLALHPIGMSDHHALLTHWTGPVVRRHLFDGASISPVQVTEIIETSERDFATEGYGLWALRPLGRRLAAEPRQSGPLIGVAGLRGHEGPFDRGVDVEILYSLEPDRWGQGLAAEASRAVLDYAFGVVGLRRVTAEFDPDSAVSAEVAASLGMRPWRRGADGPDGASYYAADRSGWLGSRRGIDAVP
ncbi:GNAT family N-acetyltransferase [Actinomadura violacea]|uniref:GNAT family N-acetyltransferase n=1 Tax=Actinomadura violacea TaxID=2819934 RepID=A0ABS3S0F3_9ACTN|nr:GNAT family protein [Actinomadura violacea]MBO2462485.1 GNAT family N-acetyltransferase [Actinomadura violacea]